MELLITRHGETEWNAQDRLQGHMDSPLTELGLKQASFLGEAARNAQVTCVYSSDLGRAFQTAALAAAVLNCDHVLITNLREQCLGVLEGLTRSEAQKKYPETYEAYIQRSAIPSMSGLESWDGVYDRTVEVLSHLAKSHTGQTVLVVCHGGNLDAAFRMAVGIPRRAVRRFSLRNASLSRFQYRKGTWKLMEWGTPVALYLTNKGAQPTPCSGPRKLDR